MLNKNTNCYNIDKNFKYSTVINTFSKHFTIFWTLSIDIWQLKCQQRQINKTKNGDIFSANFSELSNFFPSSSFWEKSLWNHFGITATVRHSCSTQVRSLPTLSCFPFSYKLFLELIFAYQTKNNVVETISCFVYQLSKKYFVYYLFEYLKYCTQINGYWLNKNACLNIV